MKDFIKLNNNKFETLLAISEEEQNKGLMKVDWPPPIMTFVFAKPQINYFWMDNTPSPLDVVFCLNKRITDIHRGEPWSKKAFGSSLPSNMVIELPFGTCKKYKIEPGDSAELIYSVKGMADFLQNKYDKKLL